MNVFVVCGTYYGWIASWAHTITWSHSSKASCNNVYELMLKHWQRQFILLPKCTKNVEKIKDSFKHRAQLSQWYALAGGLTETILSRLWNQFYLNLKIMWWLIQLSVKLVPLGEHFGHCKCQWSVAPKIPHIDDIMLTSYGCFIYSDRSYM